MSVSRCHTIGLMNLQDTISSTGNPDDSASPTAGTMASRIAETAQSCAPALPNVCSDGPPKRPQSVVLIAALDRQRGIGKDNALLWHLPEDLQHFKRTTLGCPILMGRKTWDSIGRPLPGRRNVVITQNTQWAAVGAEVAHGLADALALVAEAPKVFVIGGGQIYREALPHADELCLTEVDAVCEADTFFPDWDRQDFTEVQREQHRSAQGLQFAFVQYQRVRGGWVRST